MATYLITGGAGFIGTNLAKVLLAEGHTVRSYDNYIGGRMESRVLEGVEYIEADILDGTALVQAMQGVDGVFHMAALPRVSYSVEHPVETHNVNVNGTVNVLEAAKQAGVKRVVFSSSSAVYGDVPQELFPLSEDSVLPAPISPYAVHKLAGEHYCRLYSELYGLETAVLVYFNVYGPYADPHGAYAQVIGIFLRQVAAGEPMTICGDGEYYRDYVHVNDVARANILAMTSDKVGKGERMNIGRGKAYSVNDIVSIIGGASVHIDPRPGDPRYSEGNAARAKALLGWEPTITLEEGIEALKPEYGITE